MMNRARRKPAGHRRWGAAGERAPGGHNGDTMSKETRSRVMSRIRGKDTGPERAVAEILESLGLALERHCADLPGRPDFVDRKRKLVVFVDGDFWHGWRFPLWRHKLSPKWQKKIDDTRSRDRRNHRRLRSQGWTVVRIWEHQVEQSPDRCRQRLAGVAAIT